MWGIPVILDIVVLAKYMKRVVLDGQRAIVTCDRASETYRATPQRARERPLVDPV
jgi:hypothetical protein